MIPQFFHKDLSTDKWQALSFAEQMANVGNEVERAIQWKNKNKPEPSQPAFFRAFNWMANLTNGK